MYRDRNLNFLKKQYHNIYQIVKDGNRNEEKYILSKAKSGDANLIIQGQSEGSETILHSKYNPLREAEKWLEQNRNEIEEAENLCLYGLGLGYYLEEIITNYPEKKIYIFEPEIDIFHSYLETRDVRTTLSHRNIITFGVGNDDLSLDRFIHFFLSQLYDSFALLITPVYQRFNPKQIESFKSKMSKSALLHRSTMATNERYGYEWTDNIIKNIPTLLEGASIYNLQGAFKNIPAIIVGSGPSLQQDIQYLKELKGRAIIFAAGSSIQALTKAGIKPDLAVSIDGSESNYYVYKDLELQDIIFAAGTFVQHKVLEGVNGPLLHVPLSLDTISTYLFDLADVEPKIHSTTTVTGTCIQLAKLFGCSKIVFMGQDLSYPDDQYYASGVNHVGKEVIEERLAKAKLTVNNVAGGKNRISKPMLVMLRDIENLIKYTNYDHSISFVNTSAKGAEISGTEFKAFDEVYNELIQNASSDFSINEPLSGILQPYTAEVKEKVKRKLNHLKREIHKTRQSTTKMIAAIDQLKVLMEELKIRNMNDKIVEIEKDWKKTTNTKLYKYVLRFTMDLQLSVYLRYLPAIIQEKDILKKGQLIHKSLGKLIAQINESLDFIESNIDESLAKM